MGVSSAHGASVAASALGGVDIGIEILGQHRSPQEHRNRRPLHRFKEAADLDQDAIRGIELAQDGVCSHFFG